MARKAAGAKESRGAKKAPGADSAPRARKASGTAAARKTAPAAAAPRYRWEDAGAATAYANSCSLASTEHAVVARFGIDGRLSRRIMITPAMAKRLAGLLRRVVEDYERRFGELRLADG
jgi:hypothetical protein